MNSFYDLIDWLSDRISFLGFSNLWSDPPKVESKDGQEPTVESFREEARQADAKKQAEKSRMLSSQDRKALDKEFWETM